MAKIQTFNEGDLTFRINSMSVIFTSLGMKLPSKIDFKNSTTLDPTMSQIFWEKKEMHTIRTWSLGWVLLKNGRLNLFCIIWLGEHHIYMIWNHCRTPCRVASKFDGVSELKRSEDKYATNVFKPSLSLTHPPSVLGSLLITCCHLLCAALWWKYRVLQSLSLNSITLEHIYQYSLTKSIWGGKEKRSMVDPSFLPILIRTVLSLI